jgi:hypothetical protein
MVEFRVKRMPAATGDEHGSGRMPVVRQGAEKRRGIRVNSRVPLSVEWDSNGERLRKEAHTRVVNSYGCLVVLQQELQINQQIQVTNMISRHSIPAVVVWRGHVRTEGWERGVKLINPEMDFWGLDL